MLAVGLGQQPGRTEPEALKNANVSWKVQPDKRSQGRQFRIWIYWQYGPGTSRSLDDTEVMTT
jgi:hypothetical protein